MLSEDILLLVYLWNTFIMILEKFDLVFLLFFLFFRFWLQPPLAITFELYLENSGQRKKNDKIFPHGE